MRNILEKLAETPTPRTDAVLGDTCRATGVELPAFVAEEESASEDDEDEDMIEEAD